ncbi:MAG TPA: S8 family serine peptidase [Candidatus Limnocylindrales bacterium]|nr:S8 family serine peptidase [Candidatus Limnocylindrales bacterium]
MGRTSVRRYLALAAAVGLLAQGAVTTTAAGPDASRFSASSDGIEQTGTIVGDLDKAARTADGDVALVVELEDPAVASYRGGRNGIGATNPRANGKTRIDFKAKATKEYRAFLKGRQNAFVGRLKGAVPEAAVSDQTDLALNAVSVIVPPDQVADVAALPGVKAVYPDSIQTIDTDTSPSFIGATAAWQSLGGQESAGEGIIVGILDTGVWPEHPSYADPDPSGKAYAPPKPAPDGDRACEFTGGANPGPAFTCNNKLIGADRFMATYEAVVGLAPGEFTTARDDDGHGTHTSTTSAGNAGVTASIFGVARGTVSGIAPRAHVMAYKVCGEEGCFQSDSVAAVNEAIQDGVDVINFSIGGGASPYADAVEMAFLGAYDAGVFVAASAGNSGPGLDTTDHRGPWTTTVAASTHTRAFVNSVDVTADGGATTHIAGVSLTAGVGPAPLVVAAGDGLCSTPAAAGTYAGKIVICKRGLPAGRAEKGFNVLQGGAVGMVLYNNAPNVTDQETDNHWLPASHIQYAEGVALVAFVQGHTNVQATITAGVKGTAQGDVMASFSSRGGPGQSIGVSKPDITAPGVQILAGASPQHVGVAGGPAGELFQAIAGTSMSSPHIAGSGALLKALHPTWTPGQIKSALMTTARTAGLVKEDGTTPADAFDAGSGRVDLRVAGNPGITFDASANAYRDHPADLWTVNYPSVFHPQMPGIVTVQRTAKSVLGTSSSWKLSTSGPSDLKITVPKSFTVGAGASATFDITIDATAVPLGETRFATLTLSETKGGTRVLHMPITILRRQGPVALTKACDPTTLAPLQRTDCSITITNPTFSDATYSLSDKLPPQLKLDKASVVGATVTGKDLITATGVIPASDPANVAIAAGASPAGGYLPLSAFGVAPIAGVGDDTITNFNVPAFSFAGETWTQLGVSSNGYVVVGGGSGPDNSINGQQFPNPTRPNNTLALFWTDLNPAAAGQVRITTLTDGSDTWIVVDWAGVREFSTATALHSFEIWIGINGDANPGEDISYAYGTNSGNGDLGFASVGAENKFGNRGANTYFNGTGTLPVNGTQLVVSTTPGSVSSTTITYRANAGDKPASWTNCAQLTSDAFSGTSVSCVSGAIAR